MKKWRQKTGPIVVENNKSTESTRKFQRQLTDELEAMGSPQEVYNLTVPLFPSAKRIK